ILPLVLLAPLSFASPPAADPAAADCDRVLCYFAGTLSKVEWRIYDPARGTDKTFLTLPEPDVVRWDASMTRLEHWLGRQDVVADTEDCRGWYEGDFRPSFESDPRGGSRMRRAPAVTPGSLTQDLSPQSDGAERVESPPDCEFSFYFVPSRTVSQRGTMFR